MRRQAWEPRLLLRRHGDAEEADARARRPSRSRPGSGRAASTPGASRAASGSRRARTRSEPRRSQTACGRPVTGRSSRCWGRRPATTEMVRLSSISLASFRASSTGCTFDLKVRPKPPSKVRSRRDSIGAGSPSQEAPSGAATGSGATDRSARSIPAAPTPAAMSPAGAGRSPTSIGPSTVASYPAASHAAPNQRARPRQTQQRQVARARTPHAIPWTTTPVPTAVTRSSVTRMYDSEPAIRRTGRWRVGRRTAARGCRRWQAG